MMDRPLKVRRNRRLAAIKRHVLTAVILLAVVFIIGSLPPAFIFLWQWFDKRDGMAADQASADLKGKGRDRETAFLNVNVVPMDSERIISNQTVIVREGKIAEMGSADEIDVPRSAFKIDGTGKYLMPGLGDMHVHLQSYNERLNRSLLRIFLANGVTTILNLYGNTAHLELRAGVESGEILGPTIYTSGLFISDSPRWSPTAEEVEQEVIDQKRAGYNFIKIHGDFSRDAYRRLFEVAAREGIRVVGHAPRNLGVEPMLEERQYAVVHSEEFLYSYFYYKKDKSSRPDQTELEMMIPHITQATARAGTWVIPNLTAYKTITLQVADLDSVLSRPEVKYVPAEIYSDWEPSNNTYAKRFKKEEAPFFKSNYELLGKLVKGFRDSGVRMVAGTDTPIPSVVPGFSLHDELVELVAAGLTPYEAIKTATANVGEFLESNEIGTVGKGKRADLILVEENPLKDVRNVARRVGVMVRGQWLEESELKKLLIIY
jgi:hypothetical protein